MLTQATRLTALTTLALVALGAAAQAGHYHHAPACHRPLPSFGMHSFNNGYGEQIVQIRHGGLACRMDLEEGDTILRLNGLPLNYHGSWQDALGLAMQDGGHIVLVVRQGCGRIVTRHIDIDWHGHVIEGPIARRRVILPPVARPIGPITPKVSYYQQRTQPFVARVPHAGGPQLVPVTLKSRLEQRFNFNRRR